MNRIIKRIMEIHDDLTIQEPWDVFATEQLITGRTTLRDRENILKCIRQLVNGADERSERIEETRMGFIMKDALKKHHLSALQRADRILQCLTNGAKEVSEEDKVVWRFIWEQFYHMVEEDHVTDVLLDAKLPV